MTSEIQALQRDNSTQIYGDRSRGALLRRVVFFQVKLFMDGLRDLVMSPLSIFFGVLGILFGGRNPHGLFDRLMHMGHASDEWIDLFGVHARAGDRPSLENMLGDIETMVREEMSGLRAVDKHPEFVVPTVERERALQPRFPVK